MQGRTPQVRTMETTAAQIGTLQIRTLQITAPQIGAS
jgi:hypothetical protein